jgi:hypothetical protein
MTVSQRTSRLPWPWYVCVASYGDAAVACRQPPQPSAAGQPQAWHLPPGPGGLDGPTPARLPSQRAEFVMKPCTASGPARTADTTLVPIGLCAGMLRGTSEVTTAMANIWSRAATPPPLRPAVWRAAVRLLHRVPAAATLRRSNRVRSSSRNSIVVYHGGRGMVERLELSFRGLLVAGWGRLGHSLRDNNPPVEGGRDATAGAGNGPRPATGGGHPTLAWLYLSATVLPTVTVIPLIWSQHPWIWRAVMAATLLPIELGLLVAYKRAAPRLDARQRRVTGAEEQTMLCQAHTAISVIKATRRRLGALADQVPPQTLDEALWDLAGVLIHRDRARDTQQQLQATLTRLATGEPLAEQLQTRQARLARLRHELDTDLDGRLASLNSLADACRHFLTNQEITHQARQAAHTADTVLGTVTISTQPPGDQAADLAERTAAILDAYQQLERGMYPVGG